MAEDPTTPDELRIARDAYWSSTDYFDPNFRRRMEDSYYLFQNRHPQGSKYHRDAYRHRSKMFRPKTRAMVRHMEAAAATAIFSNSDVVSTEAVNSGDEKARASASIHKELLNYRLQVSIPWFQIVMGGMQDASVTGVVMSYQHWKYREVKKPTKVERELVDGTNGEVMRGEDGNPIMVEVEDTETKVLEDKPCVELLPIENVRIDQSANWLDPINSSPFVIRMFPMYIGDVKARMKASDPKTGQPKWKTLSEGELRSATDQTYDPTRQAREGKREDSQEKGKAGSSDFDTIWIHENIWRDEYGQDWQWYTVGVEHVLSDMKKLEEVYFHGERPIVMGSIILETHKIYPESPVQLGRPLQEEANEVANTRLDNVKLVLNKRWIAKRGAQVDLRSLVRNAPGSVTLANDPRGDVLPVDFPDVTASGYAEQDRINADYDDLLGNFSSGSVQTNRRMNETVGGMAMIGQSANQITEYNLRTVTETWIERVLAQLTKLEANYESDETIVALAAEKAQVYQKYGINQITDEMLKNDLMVRVNVGMGATDPTMKLQKFAMGAQIYGGIAANAPPNFDVREAGKEIFGLLGYRDGERFLGEEGEDPKVAQIMEQAKATVAQAMQEVNKAQQEVLKVAEETDREQEKIEQEKLKVKDTELDVEKKINELDQTLQQIGLAQDKLDLASQALKQDWQSFQKDVRNVEQHLDFRLKEIQMAAKLEQKTNGDDKGGATPSVVFESGAIQVSTGNGSKKVTIDGPSGTYTGEVSEEQ